ncbi:cytochrome c [Azospirillum sp. SYSU D00513]|uniref:cytochrome c n=1 Tax=Azospirillum sp. SYSU D00513 TaxID=2812561 RepID=UPI001A958568|nr:cytochrome c [Azospirillum sp. SYSU D00513]
MIRRALAALMLALGLLGPARPQPAMAADPELVLSTGGAETRLGREALLARADAVTVEIPRDVAYGGRAMRYRAVPLASLLQGERPPGGMLEFVATDGFAAQIPAALALSADPRGARAFLAVEPSGAPWPPLPGKELSAGPFYLVWTNPAASGVRSEQWPYQVARIGEAESPVRRWPQIAVDPALPPQAPERAGQELFITQCMACHTMNGGGSATMGPDLNLPMNPVEYMRSDGLRRLIRDPRSVRSWPGQSMPGFPPESLSDAEIDRIVAYLGHMSNRKAR